MIRRGTFKKPVAAKRREAGLVKKTAIATTVVVFTLIGLCAIGLVLFVAFHVIHKAAADTPVYAPRKVSPPSQLSADEIQQIRRREFDKAAAETEREAAASGRK